MHHIVVFEGGGGRRVVMVVFVAVNAVCLEFRQDYHSRPQCIWVQNAINVAGV